MVGNELGAGRLDKAHRRKLYNLIQINNKIYSQHWKFQHKCRQKAKRHGNTPHGHCITQKTEFGIPSCTKNTSNGCSVMKNGYLWGDDEENMALQAQAKKLVRQFNALPPEDMDGRAALLPKLFGEVGKNVWITDLPYIHFQAGRRTACL